MHAVVDHQLKISHISLLLPTSVPFDDAVILCKVDLHLNTYNTISSNITEEMLWHDSSLPIAQWNMFDVHTNATFTTSNN